MDYNALKVVDLKGLLKERDIPSTGLSRKQQYIEALESHDAGGEGENAQQKGRDPQSTGENDGTGEDGAHGQAGLENEDELVTVEDEAPANTTNAKVGDAPTAPDDPREATDQPTLSDGLPSEAHASSAPSTEPTVLEANQPVSKEPSALVTPRETSPTVEGASSDRKRKRRSPTPPIDEETVSKKLKAVDYNEVVLPEDVTHEESKVSPVVSPKVAESEEEREVRASEGMDTDEAIPTPASDPGVSTQTNAPADLDVPLEGSAESVQRSVHPATRGIYMANLVRPIQLPQLREHLTHIATPPEEHASDDLVQFLHLGSIRTHAFAIFNSISAASRARSKLHDRIWPDEPARKALWVDFVPEERVPEWIVRETEGGGGRRDTRRWEIVYDETDDGIVAKHEEVTASLSAPGVPNRRPSSISVSGQGQGMPNAPLGPRSSRPPNTPASGPAPPKQTTPNPTSSASFAFLDDRFPSTTAKPKLYYLPVAKDIADRRLDELERQTSREWGARGGELVRGEVRRYTFEDGDRLVDGGPHFDDFSGPRGGRGGRGRGGGFRGRR